MISRGELTRELLALADSANGDYIDIYEVIQKHSAGLSIEEQTTFRGTIESILTELKNAGEINFNQSELNLSVKFGGVFGNDGHCRIANTYKRREKLLSGGKKQEASAVFNISGNQTQIISNSPNSSLSGGTSQDIHGAQPKESKFKKFLTSWQGLVTALTGTVALIIAIKTGFFQNNATTEDKQTKATVVDSTTQNKKRDTVKADTTKKILVKPPQKKIVQEKGSAVNIWPDYLKADIEKIIKNAVSKEYCEIKISYVQSRQPAESYAMRIYSILKNEKGYLDVNVKGNLVASEYDKFGINHTWGSKGRADIIFATTGCSVQVHVSF